jgi:hypothetical protein
MHPLDSCATDKRNADGTREGLCDGTITFGLEAEVRTHERNGGMHVNIP